MNELQKSFIENSPSFLMHYNPNHDPRTGRFTNSLFVSGSSKTQSKDSAYYRKKLPKEVREKLKESMRAGDRIIVGDAPGVDRQVQDYLNKKKYQNVEVYGPGKEVRYSANKNWKTNPIDAPEFEVGSKEWLAKKDKAMTDAATKGLAIVLDEGSKATRNNVERLRQQDKSVEVFQLSKEGKKSDNWAKNTTEEQKISSLNKELNKFDYGVVIDGKKYSNLDSVDWSKYKTMSIADIEKYKCGICWDFVNYQHQQFKKSGIKDESYLYVKQRSNDPQDIVTHTFSVVDDGKNKKWVESSWMKHQGVHDVKSYKDVIKTLDKEYKSNYPSEVYTYNPDETIEVPNQEFFKRATKKRIQ